jgi:hypothetical protein
MVMRMRYRRSQRPSRRCGQVLFLAVLVMMLILLVGGVFVATTVLSQSSSQTDVDRTSAQGLAEAAVRFADHMLLTSPEGADWRPRTPPYALDGDGDPLTPGPYDTLADPTFTDPDLDPSTAEGYYTEMEVSRGWFSIRDGSLPGPPPPPGAYFRYGFTKYPDPRNPVDPGPDAMLGTPDDFGDAAFFGAGTVLLRLTYQPVVTDWTDPANPRRWSAGALGKCIKIEAIGRVESEGGRSIWHKITAYKPLGITDFARFITDKDGTRDPAKLFINPLIDYDGDSTVESVASAEVAPFVIDGGILANTRLTLVGANDNGMPTNQIRLRSRVAPGPDGTLGTADDVMGSVDDQSIRAPEISLEYPTPQPPLPPPSTDVYVDGRFRGSVITSADNANFDTLPYDPGPDGVPGGGDDVLRSPSVLDDRKLADPNGIIRRADRLEPPDIKREDPETGENRYLALTRDSGINIAISPGPDGSWGTADDGPFENTGVWGYGAGIFVDNHTDIQFDHDIDALQADWLQAGLTTGESGWTPTLTAYKPPAVRLTLYSDEWRITNGNRSLIETADPTVVLGNPAMIYWPNHALDPGMDGTLGTPDDPPGAPGIRFERRDIDPLSGKQRTWLDPNGNDTGLHVMYLDYPENGVIAAQGNVRAKGVLPPMPEPDGGTPAPWMLRPDGGLRDFNLTIYSGGTIYIDGQLIKPSTAVELDPSLTVDPAFANLDPDPAAPNYFYRDYYDSRIALLATDSVCLNTTQIVPHRFSRPANEVEEDPLNPAAGGHFAVPNVKDAMVRTLVRIPATSGGQLGLVAKHTGQEPGSAYISVSGNGTLYDFGGLRTVYTFLPDGTEPEGPTVSFALSPTYEYLMRPVDLDGDGVPEPPQPWVLLGGLIPGPLNWHSIAFMPPATVPDIGTQLSGGARDYWLKKFKILELVDVDADPSTAPEPIGALDIHVDALIYAQNGSWFVIPGEYFEPDAQPLPHDVDNDGTPDLLVGGDLDRDGDGVPDVDVDGDGSTATDADGDGVPDDFEYYARCFKRYGYRITITGAISENRPAGPDAARDWTDKWSYRDAGTGGAVRWAHIVYEFDDALRRTRDNPDLDPTEQTNLCALPALPVSPDLLFVDR